MKTTHYDHDFVAWTVHQATLLRQGKWEHLDGENLAEEIESLGKRDRRQLESRVERLMQHLLKWRYRPEERGRGWRSTIWEQRRRIARLLRDSPSLRPVVATVVVEGYPYARAQALDETRLPEAAIPETCPWTEIQILDDTFWPEEGV